MTICFSVLKAPCSNDAANIPISESVNLHTVHVPQQQFVVNIVGVITVYNVYPTLLCCNDMCRHMCIAAMSNFEVPVMTEAW